MPGLKHHPGADVGKRKGVTSSYTLQTAGGLSSIRTWRTDFVIPFNGIPDVSSMQTWEDCLNMSLCHILKAHHPCASWRREIAWTLDVASLQQLTRHVRPETSPMRTGKTENPKIC
jgi:hypothetical protein